MIDHSCSSIVLVNMAFAPNSVVQNASGRAKAMEENRLEAMYRAHHRVIWRTLRRMGCSPESAADYTQQAYLVAAERMGDIYVGSEKAFLFATAISIAKTAFRKLRRVDYSDEVDMGSDHGDAAQQVGDRQLVMQLLERALSKLDPDLVTVFSLHEMEGMSSPEVAEILELPLGTVASRLRRAREAFRKQAARLESTLVAPQVKAGLGL